MEARAAFDKLLAEGDVGIAAPASAPAFPRENDGASVARQNREALASWRGLGVPVPVV